MNYKLLLSLKRTHLCAKEVKGIETVNIIEEKFISNDVVTTRIFSNKDVTLEISGRSFQVSKLL